jgi:uncharacterized protein YndB with AHSA1/START domain
MSMHQGIEIAGAPERIFAYLTETELAMRWNREVIKWPPLPERGIHVGMCSRATVEEYGRRFEVENRVIALTANELLTYHMEAPTASGDIEYRLVRQDDHTRVENTITLKSKGFMWLLWPFAKRMVRLKMKSRLQLLRDLVEAEQPV